MSDRAVCTLVVGISLSLACFGCKQVLGLDDTCREGSAGCAIDGSPGSDDGGNPSSTCDPLDDRCGDGNRCGLVLTSSSGLVASSSFQCVSAGSIEEGGPCSFDRDYADGGHHDDCSAGLACTLPAGGTCEPLCSIAAGSNGCAGSDSCAFAPAVLDTIDDFGTCDQDRTVELVAAGTYSCALSNTGRVRCWGDNARGQLGYPGKADVGASERPVDYFDVNLDGLAVDIDADAEICNMVLSCPADLGHTCVVLQDGGIRCWGSNDAGQLGIGDTEIVGDDETPGSVPALDLGGRAVRVATGWTHSCAILADGAVKCWGSNGSGQLGQPGKDAPNTESFGTMAEHSLAELPAIDLGASAAEISAGFERTCAITDAGGVRCWGGGVLGYPNDASPIGDDETPASVGDVSLEDAALAIDVGLTHQCVLFAGGKPFCWGANSNAGGACLGNATEAGHVGDDEEPSSVGSPGLMNATSIQATGYYERDGLAFDTWCTSYATFSNGLVRSWGANMFVSTNDDTVGDDIVQLAVGRNHFCALLEDGEVRCWGGSGSAIGQGNDTSYPDAETAPVVQIW